MMQMSYKNILLPGIIAISMVLSGIQAVAMPLIAEFQFTREIEDRLLAPMETHWLAVEKVIAGMIQAMVSGLVVIPCAWLVMGKGMNLSFQQPLEFAAVCLLVALFSAAGGLTLGCSIGQTQIGLMFSMVVAPMMMFGCAYYPWSALDGLSGAAIRGPDQPAGVCQRRPARHPRAASPPYSHPVDYRRARAHRCGPAGRRPEEVRQQSRQLTGGRRRCQSVRDWNSRPIASSMFSENGTPTTCSATGRLSAKPQGSTSAGSPARLPAWMIPWNPGGVPPAAGQPPAIQPADRSWSPVPDRAGRQQRVHLRRTAWRTSSWIIRRSRMRLQVILGRQVQAGLQPGDLRLVRQFIHLPAGDQRLENRALSPFRIAESIAPYGKSGSLVSTSCTPVSFRTASAAANAGRAEASARSAKSTGA